MTEFKVVAVDAITSVSMDPDNGWAMIHFRQGGTDAALQFRLEEAEKVTRALSATILRLARDRGIITARDVEAYELHANLEGASLLLADSLTPESLHLTTDQLRDLHARIGDILQAAAAQPIQ
jgi:hypothetical protein